MTRILLDLLPRLWSPSPAGWSSWLSLRFQATVGEAVLQACQTVVSSAGEGELRLDLSSQVAASDDLATGEHEAELWITETAPGGAGLVDEVLVAYSSSPARFLRMVEAALRPGDFELVDGQLTRLLEMATEDKEIESAFSRVRGAEGHESLLKAQVELREVLSQKGFMVTHPVASAVNARVLRSGSSTHTDCLLRELINRWKSAEHLLGIELEARAFAYAASQEDSLTNHLASAIPGPHSDDSWRCQVYYSLLWPRGHLIRSRSLASYNPFGDLPSSDRMLVLSCVRRGQSTIQLSDAEWRDKLTCALKSTGTATMIGDVDKRSELKDALLSLIEEPLSIGFLSLHPLLEGVEWTEGGIAVSFVLEEACI